MNIVWTVNIYALTLEEKYPSYAYVFSEFDVDESYFYANDFNSFVLKNEVNLKAFYKRSLARGKDILPTMKGMLVNDGVSDLFIYLSMIESGLKSSAISKKKAVGLWQFMPATARQYNLVVSEKYDERYNTIDATSSAINYLNKLHRQFGKWYLAAMAYNCGEGCLEKAIKKAQSNDLSVLSDDNLKYLPFETRQYIKKILLIAMIGENMTLDFSVKSRDIKDLIDVNVWGGTSLVKIAKMLKMSIRTLLALNTKYKNGLLPKEQRIYSIMIPIEKVYAFYLRYELPTKKLNMQSYMISHYVRMGESVESISKIYDTEVEEIKRINHLKENFLVLDSLLVVPVSTNFFKRVSEK